MFPATISMRDRNSSRIAGTVKRTQLVSQPEVANHTRYLHDVAILGHHDPWIAILVCDRVCTESPFEAVSNWTRCPQMSENPPSFLYPLCRRGFVLALMDEAL